MATSVCSAAILDARGVRSMRNPIVIRVMIASALSVMRCNGCNQGTVQRPPGICAPETTCPKGQAYRKGVCVTERCDGRKNGDADCCPGQFCTVDGRCVSKHEQAVCTVDADCGA